MRKILFSIALFLVFSAWASAEVQNVKVSGELRLRGVFSKDLYTLNSDATPKDEVGVFESRARINVEADLTDNVLVDVELEASGMMGDKAVNRNTDGTTNIEGDFPVDKNIDAASLGGHRQLDGYDVRISQAYVQASELFYTPLTVKLGRQYLNFGRGFLISDNENEINFDAARATLDYYPIIIDGVYSRLAERTSQKLVPTDADDASMGLINAHYAADRWNVEGYVIGLVDQDTHYQPITLGLRGDVSPIEALQLWGEGAYQMGEYNKAKDLEAWAATVGATYTFEYTWHPSLSLAYAIASGEDNSEAETYKGFQELFEYSYYGYAFSPKLENIQFINARVSILPLENLTLALDYYHYWQLEKVAMAMGDPFQDNGGVAALTTGNSNDLGNEIDVVAEYDYTEDVSTQLYVAWFLPGEAYTPDDAAFEIRGEILVSF